MSDEHACLVTGAGGYLGSRIVDYLRGRGTIVHEMHHHLPPGRMGDSRVALFSLKDPVDSAMFTGIDCLIHCAYDLTQANWTNIEMVNIFGTLRLLETARRAGVQKLIFISSLSAFEGCKSMYGRAKLMVEKEALKSGVIVVRPGLVYDEQAAGLVAVLTRLVTQMPVIPLIGGNQVLYTCHSADLSALIYELCTMPGTVTGPVIAACEQPLKFGEILRLLAAQQGKTPFFVPVPYQLVLLGLLLLEAVGWRGRLKSDSLISLLNPNPAVDFTYNRALGTRFRPFRSE